MRAIIIALATALTMATVASAADPPATPLDLSAPSGSELPDMGSPAETILSKRDEAQLGAMVAKELRDQNAVIEDPEITAYLQSVGTRLAAQSVDGARDFHYQAVKDPAINAFAVPGGYIFINSGLILASTTESELAGVMAHETAHVTQHHIARFLRRQQQQSLVNAAAMLGAILLGAMAGGQAAEGGIMAAQGMAVQQQINFTRDNEAEADRVGIGYMAGAGFEPKGMGDFFETLSRRYSLSTSWIPPMLLDHPVTTDRIAEARARAAQMPPVHAKDSLSYQLIKERVRVLMSSGDVDMVKQYETRVATGDHSVGTRYGQALALMADRRPIEAAKILHELTQEHQDLTLLYSALGEAESKAGHQNDALSTFKRSMALFPRNVPLTVRYAQALMAAGNPEEAHRVLLDLFNNEVPTPDQIRLTAQAASAAGDLGDAYSYMGEYQIANGDLMLAVQQFQLALASPNLTDVQRQRIRARLDELREYLRTTKMRRASNTGP
jgi:predicted Zn-dependent protease